LTPKILCVDDEPSILQALERLFKDQFQVLTSTSAQEAFNTLKNHSDCAVVLSDYRMPEMNGVDFLREVRRLYPLTSRAILSGQIDLAKVSEAINRSDIHKFFLKPWENDYLSVQMMEALQLHRTLREKAHFEHLSVTDPVTQVTNHRFFQDQLRRELHKVEDGGALTLVLFDVDHFKAFNDRFGHPEGDRLLFSVAKTLEKLVNGAGHVSRYGGEEFTLILPGRSRAQGLEFAERVRQHFERTPFPGLSSSPSYITVSAGLATFPEHGRGASELIENADRALYKAKRQGRNQVAVATGKK
jgi:diguanylate cyclase (GGDEF)-like protein